jgi:chemotaxis signal transduction protein
VGDNRDIAQALLAAHYNSIGLGRACEYPKDGIFSSLLIYSRFMTNELMPLDGLDAPAGTDQSDPSAQVVPCRIGGRLYGVPLDRAGDMVILTTASITPISFAPPVVKGAVSQQGRMATVIDTRMALGLPPAEATSLVGLTVEHGPHLYVLTVDEVGELAALHEAGEAILPLDIAAVVAAR